MAEDSIQVKPSCTFVKKSRKGGGGAIRKRKQVESSDDGKLFPLERRLSVEIRNDL